MAAAAYLGNPVLTRVALLGCTSKPQLTSLTARKMTPCLCAMDSKSVGVGGDVFSVTSSAKSGVDYLGQSTKGDMNLKLEHLEAFGADGEETLEGPIEEVARLEAQEAEDLLSDLGIPVSGEAT